MHYKNDMLSPQVNQKRRVTTGLPSMTRRCVSLMYSAIVM